MALWRHASDSWQLMSIKALETWTDAFLALSQ
jgi:hypothetical protein